MLNDVISLAFRPDLGVFTMRWLEEPTQPADVQGYYEQALDAARPHHPACWLIDVRRRPMPDPHVALWFGTTWLPQVAALAAPRTLRLAYLLSPLRQRATFDDPALAPANARILAPNQLYVVETFLDEGAAMRWLLS
ncbi:hypothetical protein GCM10023185_01370 [Hymenobacter saemangeumensis]|uniref:STAS/SEC14 domain-containing protein n=1 Tax=Hymenobacter saemangeumensis TaxID=1084522 RepID=A0ABP8HXD1_9BACT